LQDGLAEYAGRGGIEDGLRAGNLPGRDGRCGQGEGLDGLQML